MKLIIKLNCFYFPLEYPVICLGLGKMKSQWKGGWSFFPDCFYKSAFSFFWFVAISDLSDGALQCLSLCSHRVTVQYNQRNMLMTNWFWTFHLLRFFTSRTVCRKQDGREVNSRYSKLSNRLLIIWLIAHAEFPFMYLTSRKDRGHAKLQNCNLAAVSVKDVSV